MKQKIALIIASRGYQQIEYGVPKKMLEAAGYAVTTASDTLGTAVAKDQSTTQVDILIKDIDVTKFAALIFIGGPGAMELLDNTISYQLCQAAVAAHVLIGAICITPRILAKAGVLEGRVATGWNEDGKLATIFLESGTTYAPEDVVVEDLFVTATGPKVADQFAEQLITILKNRSEMQDFRQA